MIRIKHRQRKVNVQPGVCDNPIILNLHLLLWDSYIAANDARPPLQWKAERAAAVTHLALLGVKR